MCLRQFLVFGMAAGLTVVTCGVASAQGSKREGASLVQSFQAQLAKPAARRSLIVSRKALVRSTPSTAVETGGRHRPDRLKDGVEQRPKDAPKRPGSRPKPDKPNDTVESKPDRRPGRRPPALVLPLPLPATRSPQLVRPVLPLPRSAPPMQFVEPSRPAMPAPPISRVPPPLPPLPPSPPLVVTTPEFVPAELLITVATSALPQLEAELALLFNVTIRERTALPLIDARLVRLGIPDGRAAPAVVALLTSDPRVVSAQLNYIYRLNGEPMPTPAVSTQSPGLQYALAKLEVTELHRVAIGRGTTIAVIDSGVDGTHPDFAGLQIAHFDANSDGAGSISDQDTHGTGIAGIIAARGIVKGLAPAAALVSARVFRKTALGSIATTEAILKGLTWSAEHGARVLNMSFAGPRDPLVERHIKVTTARGMISVAAAGNNGALAAPAFPAAYDDVVAVTAVDASDRLFAKANRGGYIAVAAPGVDVIVPSLGHAHHFQSGTSMAAAHVSAVVALLLEVEPRLSPHDIRQLLISSSEDLGAVGRDDDFGSGRVNALRAIGQLTDSRGASRR